MPQLNPAAATIYRQITRAALLGLVVNLSLASVKLAGGIVGNSFALISDAINSLGDTIVSLGVLFAFHVAQQPPDEEHPYGHTRAESIAASNAAVVIVLSALYVGWEAIARLWAPPASPAVWTLWIAGANVLIKEALYQYKARLGRQTGSSAIVASAWDHRADALCSLAVLIGLALVHWGGASFRRADEFAAIAVVSAILYNGLKLFLSSASELMDAQAPNELVNQIRRAAAETPGVLGVEKLRVRKSGVECFCDIHIEVDPAITVEAGHAISHAVKDRLLSQFATLRDALVHLEPHPHDC